MCNVQCAMFNVQCSMFKGSWRGLFYICGCIHFRGVRDAASVCGCGGRDRVHIDLVKGRVFQLPRPREAGCWMPTRRAILPLESRVAGMRAVMAWLGLVSGSVAAGRSTRPSMVQLEPKMVVVPMKWSLTMGSAGTEMEAEEPSGAVTVAVME